MPARIRAVVFDLDGTLLDSLEDIADSMNAVLASRGLPLHPLDAYRTFVGDGVATLVQRALPEPLRTPERIETATAEMREEYAARWDRKTRPYPGIPALLDELVARGFKLGVLSNKPDLPTRLCVEKLLPRWRFDDVRGARPDVPRKPDPAAALALASRLEVEPAQVLYLGDTDTDMRTAVNAGFVPVGVLWGFRTADELRAHGARILIERPGDLVAYL